MDPSTAIKIVCAGFLGMRLDSVLGSLFQAKYRDLITGALSDAPGKGKERVTGFGWMTNDLVNFLAILAILLGVWIVEHLVLFL